MQHEYNKIFKWSYVCAWIVIGAFALGCVFVEDDQDDSTTPGTTTNNQAVNNNNTSDNNQTTNNNLPPVGDRGPLVNCDYVETLSEHITEDLTLTPGPETGCVQYIVSKYLNVSAGLTIEPGVILVFEADAGFNVSGADAYFTAVGTAELPIVLTTARTELNRTQGDWRGIIVRSNHALNELSYVEVSFGGGKEHGYSERHHRGNVYVKEGARLKINNSYFSQSGQHGIVMERGVHPSEFANNRFEHNEAAPVYLPAHLIGALDKQSQYAGREDHGNKRQVVIVSGGTVDEDELQMWKAIDVPYHITDYLTIASGVEIEAGAEFQFTEDAGFAIDGANAFLKAVGDASNPIVMTSDEPVEVRIKGRWRGLIFRSAQHNNELSFVDIGFGGGKEHSYGERHHPANIYVAGNARLKLNNTTSHNSAGYGLMVEENSTLTEFSANAFANNDSGILRISARRLSNLDSQSTYLGGDTRNQFIHVYGTGVEDTDVQTWSATDAPYRFINTTSLESGVKIEAGAVLEFENDAAIEVAEPSGYLEAIGEAGNPIVFTSSFEESVSFPGHWSGIIFRSFHAMNHLSHVEMAYGAGKEHSYSTRHNRGNVYVTSSSRLQITDSVFRNFREVSDTSKWGIYCESGATVTHERNSFDDAAEEYWVSPNCD